MKIWNVEIFKLRSNKNFRNSEILKVEIKKLLNFQIFNFSDFLIVKFRNISTEILKKFDFRNYGKICNFDSLKF